MRSLPELIPEKLAQAPVARGLVLLLIGLCTLGVFFYVQQGTVNTVTRDEWRFLDLLHHWYDGRFSWADIWGTNTSGSEHRVPVFKAYFLANALWFGLDTRIGCYIGVLALGAFALLGYRYFLRARSGAFAAFDHYAFLPVALTLFSYTQAHIYTYDLLAVFTITGTLAFAAVWMEMDLQLRGSAPLWRLGMLCACLFLALLLFGAGKGPALALASSLLALLLAAQAGERRKALKLLTWILLATLAAEFVYWHGGAGKLTGVKLRELVGNALQDPAGAAKYILQALGASVITMTGVARDARPVVILVAGGLLLVTAVAALLVYWRTRMYRHSALPPVFALFVAAYLAELVIGRFGGGTENGAAPRYVFTDHLLVVACAWVFADAARGLWAAGERRRAAAALAALMLVMGAVELANLRAEYGALDSQIAVQNDAVNIARSHLTGATTPFPGWYCPSQKLCDEGIQFLAEHRLSLFREGRAPQPESAP